MRKELLLAEFAPQAKPEQGGRRKDLVFYSGAEIDRYDFWTGEEYTLQFSLKKGDFRFERLANAPLLKDHWPSVDSQVGHIEDARIEDGVAMATAVFADTEDVTPLWEKVAGGHIRNVSMGVAIDELKLLNENRKKGEKKRFLAIGWEPREISVVPLGADPKASFVFSQDEEMPREVRAFLRDLYAQHLAKTGAAGTADEQPDHRLRLALARQRQHELTLR